jgi:hypothetical protein
MKIVTKILDGQKLTAKLTISGSPSANIKAFLIEEESGAKVLKISCSNWNSASVALKAKTNHSDDSFSETGVTYTENLLEQIELF